jgi:hypothetical protein
MAAAADRRGIGFGWPEKIDYYWHGTMVLHRGYGKMTSPGDTER